MNARVLFQGQSAHTVGTVYYDVQDGLLITKMDSPYKQLVRTSALGEYSSYEFTTNQVMMSQGMDFSSKNSFLYTFLSGQIGDMGLRGLGYKLIESNIEDGLLVNTWAAPENQTNTAQFIKIVSENNLPIFIGFYDGQMNIKQKTYYTNFQPVSYMQIPLTITEIEYTADADSMITQRKYSDLKLNSAVDQQWFNFTIPSDAKVVNVPTPGMK
ncbi:MAG: hypothetical protein Salg2KO_00990 [Salibacteraceae bacterium]